MLDIYLLRSHYFRGPLTEEQQSELFAALKNAGIYANKIDLTKSNGNDAYLIVKSCFSDDEFLAFRTIYAGGWTNIPSYFKEIKFEDLYIPKENMEFSWEAICELLGADLNGSKP